MSTSTTRSSPISDSSFCYKCLGTQRYAAGKEKHDKLEMHRFQLIGLFVRKREITLSLSAGFCVHSEISLLLDILMMDKNPTSSPEMIGKNEGSWPLDERKGRAQPYLGVNNYFGRSDVEGYIKSQFPKGASTPRWDVACDMLRGTALGNEHKETYETFHTEMAWHVALVTATFVPCQDWTSPFFQCVTGHLGQLSIQQNEKPLDVCHTVVLRCLERFRQKNLTTRLRSPRERGIGCEGNHAWSCRRKPCDVCLLPCTNMPLPGNEPISITFVQTGGGDTNVCMIHHLSTSTTLIGRILSIFFLTSIFRIRKSFASHSAPNSPPLFLQITNRYLYQDYLGLWTCAT